MSYTRAQWATAFLQAVGNANPNPKVVQWVVAWTTYETSTGGGAAYNLLNTTQDATGATAFNHFGPNGQYSVKNYTSFTQGVQANAKALSNGYYKILYPALKNNQLVALGIGAAPASGIDANLSTWGTGPVAAKLAAITGHGSETFPGSTPAFGVTGTNVAVQAAQSNTYPKGQCTWWADQRYHDLTGYYVPWSGNAKDWANNALQKNWKVSSTPTVPSIMCLQAGVQGADGTYGHVGVVEKIGANGTFTASNQNWGLTPAQRASTQQVTFHTGTGVSFITASAPGVTAAPGQDPGTSTNTPQTGGLVGDITGVVNAWGALFGGTYVAPAASVLSQVHTVLIDHPGFYGIALALDEAEQLPGYQNLASGPWDVIGMIRSVGATIGDNFLPVWIRGTLIGLGLLIIVLLIAKVVLQVGEGALSTAGKLLPLLA